MPPTIPIAPKVPTSQTALAKAGTCQEPLDTDAPAFDAALGALHTVIRLRLSTLQAWLLLKLIRAPETHLSDLANEAQRPLPQIVRAIAKLAGHGLILLPANGRIHPTKAGRATAAHLIAITALAEASNVLRQASKRK